MVDIRPIEERDHDAVWRIVEPVFRAGETYAYAPDITREDALRVWVAEPTATFVAVEDGDTVLGTYYIKPNLPALGAHVCNCGYIVAAEARGQGIASEMCGHSQREALARGFRAMQYNLVVSTNQAAIRLWQSLGFAIVGSRETEERYRFSGRSLYWRFTRNRRPCGQAESRQEHVAMNTVPSALWPAHLHHLCLRSGQAETLANWYADHLELGAKTLDQGRIWLRGAARNLIVEQSSDRGLGFAAYALDNADQVSRLDAELTENNVARSPVRSPIFADEQVSILDPDGNVFVFGIPSHPATDAADRLPGRLQHLGITTTDIDRLRAFFVDTLGFQPSDIVKNDDGAVSACFLRCDHEHHALALFAASSARFDHQCYETSCWNDIRDWGDHFSARRTEIEWGAARHGAGNNLFIFVRDPDGHPVELSAELETRTFESPPGEWKTEARTLNLWGSAWSRT